MFPKIVSRRPTNWRYVKVVADTFEIATSLEGEPVVEDEPDMSPWSESDQD